MLKQVLRIYEDDDETVAFEYSTDPTDPLPYLKPVVAADEQEIDIRDCSATVGAIVCELVDVPTIAGDQDSGAITGALPNAQGESVWIGHRAEFLREPSGGGSLVTVFDGIVGALHLLDTLVTYRVTLEDTTARGRKVGLFTHHETASMIPPGPVNGFGKVRRALGSNDYVIAPVGTVDAEYFSVSASSGYFRLDVLPSEVPPYAWEASLAHPLHDDAGGFLRYAYSRMAVRWRANSGDSWKTFRRIPQTSEPGWRLGLRDMTLNVRVWVEEDPDDPSPPALPADGADVEVQVLYSGPPTPAFPLYVEGPAGEVLRDMIDGVYSPDENGDPQPLRIRYDETRMTELEDEAEDLFAAITEPADDAREWLLEHWFSAFGYLPTIRNGLLYPIRLEMPDESPTLVLDNTNTAGKPEWRHERKSAVTRVEYTYIRHDIAWVDPLSYLPDTLHPNTNPWLPDVPLQLARTFQEVTLVYQSLTSATIGEEVVRIQPVTVREIFGTGFAHNKSGRPIAMRRAKHLIDRMRYGGQTVTVKASRHDVLVDAAHVGDWAILGPSSLPEYETGRRGSNRLAQIIAARNVDDRWRQFVLLDAGPDLDVLDVPTIGALVANADGTVDVPVTAIPEGEAAVYYAFSASQPAASSGEWLLAARLSASGTVKTPPAQSGETVHVRVRAEAEGRIYSASVYDDVIVPVVPRLRDVRVEIVGGVATVRWTPNDDALGVRIAYSVQADASAALFDATVDVDAATEEYALPIEIPAGYTVAVRVTPYTGWTGSAVSGTAGLASEVIATDRRDFTFAFRNLRIDEETTSSYVYAWEMSVPDGEAWGAIMTFALPLPDDAWDLVAAAVAPLGPGGSDLTLEVPKPDDGEEVLVHLEARGPNLEVGELRRIVVSAAGRQPPVHELDDAEDGVTGTQWIAFVERGIPISSVTAQTQVGTAPWSSFAAPLRGPGAASVVKGGTLGPLEYEHDVTLDLTRFSWITYRVTLANGQTIDYGPFGFDRNRMPDFVSEPTVDETWVTLSGDSDTNSVALIRSDGGGAWMVERDGGSLEVDVSGDDDSGNPGIGGGERWTLTAVLRSDPSGDVDVDTLTRERTIVVEGFGGSTAGDWEVVDLTVPAIGDDAITISLKASVGTGSAHIFEKHRESGGTWSTEVEITGDLSPALSTPPVAETDYSWDSAFGRQVKALGVPIVTFEIRAELRDGLGIRIDNETRTLSFYAVGA